MREERSRPIFSPEQLAEIRSYTHQRFSKMSSIVQAGLAKLGEGYYGSSFFGPKYRILTIGPEAKSDTGWYLFDKWSWDAKPNTWYAKIAVYEVQDSIAIEVQHNGPTEYLRSASLDAATFEETLKKLLPHLR
jgi:hypothetical protein